MHGGAHAQNATLAARGGKGPEAPTLLEAAKARKQRSKTAVLGPQRGVPELRGISSSELCAQGRGCVRSWARGYISGTHCMQRLELCSTVANLVERAPGGSMEDKESEGQDVALWLNGCIRLGGRDPRFDVVRCELEEKSPAQVLDEARRQVEQECGAHMDSLHAEEVSSALQRMSLRAAREASEPGEFLRIQIWRELVHMSLVKDTKPQADTNDIHDSAILAWMHLAEAELRDAARRLPTEKLASEADRLLAHAAQMIRLGGRLRRALEGWQRHDAYRTLGVSRNASLSEIRRAFYKQALLLHPDKGGDKEAFQELQEAYNEILAELSSKGVAGASGADDETCWGSSPRSPLFRTPRRPPPRQEEQSTPGMPSQPSPSSQSEDIGVEHQAAQDSSGVMDGVDIFEELAGKASALAARSGEFAVEVLRHCYAAVDAVQDMEGGAWGGVDPHYSAGLESAQELLEVTRSVGETVEQLIAELEASSLAASSDSQLESQAETLQQARQSAAAVFAAADNYKDSIALVVTARSAATEEVLVDALHALVHASKATTVAALDAGVAAVDAAALERKAPQEQQQQEEAGSPGWAEDAAGQRAFDDAEAEAEAGGAAADFSASTMRSDGSQDEDNPTVDMLLQAVQMLQVTNREMLKLQRNARELAASRPKAVPVIPSPCASRAFTLLAEFLDEACLTFHDSLRSCVDECHEDVSVLQESWATEACETCFPFILLAEPGLAVPMDPRTQTLRAAVALDVGAVRRMLSLQVAKRLENSLMVVVLDLRARSGEEAGDPVEVRVLQLMMRRLLHSVSRLESPQ